MSKPIEKISFAVLIAFIAPITFSTIHGDDFAVPFSLVNSSNNSYSIAIKNISWTVDGHFNFLGEFIAVLWGLSLARIYQLTESVSTYFLFYSLTKFIVFTLYCALFYFISNRLLNTDNSARVNPKLLSLGVFVFFFGYRTTWSSDPAGNYPLLGYSSAILGILTIAIYTSKSFSNRLPKDYLLIYGFAILGSFYYELNALVLVIIIIVDVSFGVIEKNRTLFIAPTLVLFSALYILLPKVIANSSGYEGTDVSIELVSIRTFLVQIFSALPLSTIPLAIYLYPGLLVFILLALVLLVRMQFFQSSVRPLDLPKLCEMSVRDKLFLAMLTSYALLSAGAFALSEKYQKEILWPGQTYMASPVIQFMFMLITFQFLWINMDKIRNFYGIAIVLLCLNFTFNTALVYNMHLKNFASSQLIEGLVGAEENKRCEYLQDWVLEERPIYYKEWVIESLQGTHKIWFGEKYCGSQP